MVLAAIAVVIVGLALATSQKTYESAELGVITIETTPIGDTGRHGYCSYKATMSPKLGNAFSANGWEKLPCTSPLVQRAALSRLLDEFLKQDRNPDWWLNDMEITKWIKVLWDAAAP